MSASPSLKNFAKKSGAFLIVGGGAFVVDALVFNLLAFGVSGYGPMFDAPLLAKSIAILLATLVTYVGNRYWTFGSRQIDRKISRYLLFAAFNVLAIAIQLGCLAFSRYALQLEGPLADNISGTLVGQALATLFRFFTYDRWVFPDGRNVAADSPS